MGLKTGLERGSSVSQIFLIILNIVFALMALAVLILGIYIRTNDVVDPRITDLFTRVDMGGLNMGDLLLVLAGFIIAMGVFSLLVAGLGGFGACGKIRVLLIIYVIVLSIIVLIELILLGLWSKLVYGVDTWVRDQFLNIMRYYNGIGNNDVYSKGWNYAFMMLDCCAVNPVSGIFNDFATLPSDWWTSGTRGFDVVPYTCCKEANLENFYANTNPTCTQTLIGLRQRGCYDAFKELMTRVATPTIVFSILLIITETSLMLSCNCCRVLLNACVFLRVWLTFRLFQILAIVAAIVIVVHVTKQERRTGKINGAVFKGRDTKPQ